MDDRSDDSELIIPCDCEHATVHRKCLDKWRINSDNPDSLTICDICERPYIFEPIQDNCTHYLAKIHLFLKLMFDLTIIIVVSTIIIMFSYYLTTFFNLESSDDSSIFPIITKICLTIVLTGINFIFFFVIYILVSLMVMRICHYKHKLQLPYLLYLITYNSKSGVSSSCDCNSFDPQCFLFLNHMTCDCNGSGDAEIILFLCTAFCCCIISVEFIYILVKIFTIHIRNIYKDSHCRVYRIKNLSKSIASINSQV